MSPEQFVYWFNGYMEISGAETLTKDQVEVIRRHLALVLTNVTADAVGKILTTQRRCLDNMSEASSIRSPRLNVPVSRHSMVSKTR